MHHLAFCCIVMSNSKLVVDSQREKMKIWQKSGAKLTCKLNEQHIFLETFQVVQLLLIYDECSLFSHVQKSYCDAESSLMRNFCQKKNTRPSSLFVDFFAISFWKLSSQQCHAHYKVFICKKTFRHELLRKLPNGRSDLKSFTNHLSLAWVLCLRAEMHPKAVYILTRALELWDYFLYPYGCFLFALALARSLLFK